MPRPTKAQLVRFLEIQAEQKRLRREATDLNAELEPIAKQLEEFVREKGGKQRSLVSCGHRIALKLTRGTVPWKKEFIRAQGQDAAEALVKAAPTKESLTVEAV